MYIKKKYIYIYFLPEGFISKQKKEKTKWKISNDLNLNRD